MKMTDGLFHKVFDEIGALYPDIEKEVWIVDIGAAKMADTPTAFDVIVMPNLYGDILSDVAAQIAGSVGLAGSANIGDSCAMFEAIHGSAPRRAGQNLANPPACCWAPCSCWCTSTNLKSPLKCTMPGCAPSRMACTPTTSSPRASAPSRSGPKSSPRP